MADTVTVSAAEEILRLVHYAQAAITLYEPAGATDG